MHIAITTLILFWLQSLPVGSAAPASANTTAEVETLRTRLHPQSSHNLRPNAAQILDYHIPGTTTTIHFVLGPPLPPAVMSDTILSAHIHILSTIAAKGDSVLSASEDPFVYDPGYGAFIRARSANGRHLTWTFLEGVVVALHNGLFLRGRYRASEFWIWDGVLGLVGLGEMGAGAVGGGVGMGTVVSVGKGNGEGNGNGTVSKVLDIAQEWRY